MSKFQKIWEYFYPFFTYVSIICIGLSMSLYSVDGGDIGLLGVSTWIETPLLMWLLGSIGIALWSITMIEIDSGRESRGEKQGNRLL